MLSYRFTVGIRIRGTSASPHTCGKIPPNAATCSALTNTARCENSPTGQSNERLPLRDGDCTAELGGQQPKRRARWNQVRRRIALVLEEVSVDRMTRRDLIRTGAGAVAGAAA